MYVRAVISAAELADRRTRLREHAVRAGASGFVLFVTEDGIEKPTDYPRDLDSLTIRV